MKPTWLFLVALALALPPLARAQDAATDERLNKLSGRLDDLQAAQDALRRQIAELTRENASLRDQLNKPTASYATAGDLQRLADAIKEVDRKRMDDAERIHNDLLKLAKELRAPPPAPSHKPAPPREDITAQQKPNGSENGYEYIVKKGDTLSSIVQAYRDNNIKVTVDQLLKANPRLKPEKMYVGQKLWVPAP
jgi:LysM repeat protein